MEDISDTKTTTPLTTPKATVDPFPHKRHYESGYIFNMPISHYAERTEAEIRQSLLDGGNSEQQVEFDMKLINEGLAFHKTSFKKEEPLKKA